MRISFRKIYKTIVHVGDSWEIGLLIFCYFLSSIFISLFAILTKSYFTPTLMAVSDSFTIICWTLLLAIIGKDSESKIEVGIVGYVIVFIGCIIYNEIIILYFCDLEWNCKIEISRRSALDMSLYEDNTPKNELNAIIEFDMDKNILAK